jgi:hypothetical protein
MRRVCWGQRLAAASAAVEGRVRGLAWTAPYGV